MENKDFQSKDRRFFIDYLPDEIWKRFTKNDLSNHSKYRDRHRKYHQALLEYEEHEKKVREEINRLQQSLEERKTSVQSVEKEMLSYYEKLKHYDKVIKLNAWKEIEWRNKKKCLQDESIKPKYRLVVVIEYRFQAHKRGNNIQRKKFHFGDWERTRNILKIHETEDYTQLDNEDLVPIILKLIECYSRWFIYMNGFSKYHRWKTTSSNAMYWAKAYDKKFGMRKWEDWYYEKNRFHFSNVQNQK